MSRSHQDFLDLCAGHVLGAVDAAEEPRLMRHLAANCPDCERALAEFAEVGLALASTALPATPDPELRDRVMEAVRREPQKGTGSFSNPVRPAMSWGWMAAALVLFLGDVAAVGWAVRVRQDRDRAQAMVAELEARLRTELATRQDFATMLLCRESRQATLAPTPAGDATLRGWVSLDAAQGRAILVFTNLTPKSGRDYELWALYGDHPQSLGVIQADADGFAHVQRDGLATPGEVSAFAVSMEPVGGSKEPVPTGPVVMVGAL